MNRQSVAVLILVVWVGALGWLFSRRTGPTGGVLLDDATRTVEPGTLYYPVSMGGVPVGFASNTVDTVPEGLLIEDRLTLEIPALGAIQRVEATTRARLTNTLRLQTFVARLVGDAGRFTVGGPARPRECSPAGGGMAVPSPGPAAGGHRAGKPAVGRRGRNPL